MTDTQRFADLVRQGATHEIRMIDHARDAEHKRIKSWYLDDITGLLASNEVSPELTNVYLGLNPVVTIPTRRDGRPAQAKASNISRIANIAIDIDAVRATTTPDEPASREENEGAIAHARRIVAGLAERDITPVLLASTGNGSLIIIRADMATTDQPLVAQLLAHLATVYPSAQAKVDTTVSDLPRIIRLVGTDNCKPDGFSRSRLLDVYDTPTVVTADMLRGIIPTVPAPRPAPEPTTTPPPNKSKSIRVTATFEQVVDRFRSAGCEILKQEIPTGLAALTSGSTFVIRGCPVRGAEHANADTWVCLDSGRLRSRCHHQKCECKTIIDVLRALNIPYTDLATVNVMEHGGPGIAAGTRIYSHAQLAGVLPDLPLPDTSEAIIATRRQRDVLLTTRYTRDADIPTGWLRMGGKLAYTLVDHLPETPAPESMVRAIFEVGKPSTKRILQLRTPRGWEERCRDDIYSALVATGLDKVQVAQAMHSAANLHPHRGQYLPFGPDELGNNTLNTAGPCWLVDAVEGPTPHLQAVFGHAGSGLDDVVAADPWCKQHSILTGADYLMCWFASAVQQPAQPLPMLALFSPEQGRSGKSTLAEMVELLVQPSLIQKAKKDTLDKGFTGNLDRAVFVLIEELNLNTKTDIAVEIKRRVTARMLETERKGYDASLSAHWGKYIHTCNTLAYVPITPGDDRIVLWRVPPIAQIMPDMRNRLQDEAPAIRYALQHHYLPPQSAGRSYLPVLCTREKQHVLDTLIASSIPDWLLAVAETGCAEMTAAEISAAATRAGHPIARQRVAALLAAPGLISELAAAGITVTQAATTVNRKPSTTYSIGSSQ